ncbi:tetratricopeptide repeat protein [Paenibacillus taiwanensis]|uniref:tetratricopeptide repeat protein n=1 Tax=Paenibacillus taiwanensis TaxID=401638 RepID=UPI00041C4B7B|nr:hypothetical protein [Paenibacillus taiwanensis]
MINWKMLGISPTDDKAAIKKAYAKQLRVYHPEDHPEDYQRLREAFDAAMKQAGKSVPFVEEQTSPEIIHSILVRDERPDPERLHTLSPLSSVNETEVLDVIADGLEDQMEAGGMPNTRIEPLQLFWQGLHERYRDISRRVDPQQWESLLNEDYMWDMGTVEKRFDVLMRFLAERRYMPHDVWTLLDLTFELSKNLENRRERYDNDVIEYITLQISGTMEMGYVCFVGREFTFDIDDYLSCREAAQFFLMRRQFEDAEQRLAQANELFQEDPDLQLMRAKFALMNGAVSEEVLGILNQVISYNPQEWEAYLLRGRLLFNEKQYKEAQQDAELLLQQVPKSQDARCLAIECYMALNQLEKAWAIQNEPPKIYFRYCAVIMALCNKQIYAQKPRKKSFKYMLGVTGYRIMEFLLLLWKLNWKLLLIYIASGYIIGFGSLPAYIAAGAMLWRTWKSIRATYLLLT